MEHTDLKTKMEEYCVYIENALEKCIPEQEALPPDVYEAMRVENVCAPCLCWRHVK